MRYLVLLAFLGSTWAKAESFSKDSAAIEASLPEIPSELLVETLSPGEGEGAELGDLLSVHYIGKLQNGSEFDNSYKRGKVLDLVLGSPELISGWTMGLTGMKIGEKRHLLIPPQLAYGERDLGVIPPNSVLDFEVELVNLRKPRAPDTLREIPDSLWLSHPRGLEFYVEKEGVGPVARPGTLLKVHYTGWLLGGTSFGSSKSTPVPAEFTLGSKQVISGWEYGLDGIRAGEIRWLKIPPHLGYANQPMARIPPNSTLIFKVEAVEVHADPNFKGDLFPQIAEIPWLNLQAGLRYHIEQEGEGAGVQKGETVKVHYTGWLTDGTEFDSSRPRRQSFSFAVGSKQVIPGWDIGVEGMKVGERRWLYISAPLAYGARTAGIIPANSDLIFVVERVE